MITDDSGCIIMFVIVVSYSTPAPEVERMVQPLRTANLLPWLLISINSRLLDMLVEPSGMNRVNRMSSGDAKLAMSGSACPGVGHKL